MKKKLLKNKIEKENFLRLLEEYLRITSREQSKDHVSNDGDRKFFGWALYLSIKEGVLLVNILEPRQRLLEEPGNYIRFAENLGVLKIGVKTADYQKSFEIECHQRLPESREIRSYFKQLNDLMASDSDVSKIKISGVIYLLAATFTELVFDAPHLDQYLSDTRRQMMIKVNGSISRMIGTQFSAQDVVEDLGYSIQYLNKVSQDFRALSLNNYINFCKLELFRNKLNSMNGKVSEIALECGFPDVNYLIQLFKRTYFITPLQLKKKMKSSTPEERVELHKTSGFVRLKQINRPEHIKNLSIKDKRCSLIVANLSHESLELYWLSPEGEEVPMTLLDGLERMQIGSAEGHCWMTKKGSETAFFKVGKENCLIAF